MPVGLKDRKKPQPPAAPKQPAAETKSVKKPKKQPNAFYGKIVARALTVGLRESQDMEPSDAMQFLEAFHTELQSKIQKGDYEPPFLDSAVIAAKERVKKQRELDSAK